MDRHRLSSPPRAVPGTRGLPFIPVSAFIGRREELDLAHLGLREADGLLVTGEAGVGKSLLLAEIEHRLAASDRRTVRLPTSAATAGISLWPFQRLLPQAPPSDLLDLARHVHHHLVDLGRSERITLVVDDVNHLDEPSIGMLDHLLQGGHVRLAATIRAGEPNVDALDELWSRFDVREVVLEGLPVDDCAVIVERLLGGPVSPASIGHLTDAAQGNPLLLRELVLDAVENGTLQQFDDGWQLLRQQEVATQAIGDRTRLCVQRRVARLGPDEQDLVTLLAVAGDIQPEIVPAHLTAALKSLEARRIASVRADRPGEWSARLDHPLLAEVVLRDMTGSTRRDALRRLVAYTRQTVLGSPGAATRLALWAEASGDPLTAAEWLRATNEAVTAFDHDAASRWARRAAAIEPDSHAAHLALGAILRHQGRLTEAAREFEAAESCAVSDDEVATAAIEHGTLVALQLGRPGDAVAALHEAEARVVGRDHARSLRSEAAVLGTLLGTFDEVLFAPADEADHDVSDGPIRWQLGLNELYSRTMVGRLRSIEDLTASTLNHFASVEARRPHELDYVLGLQGVARLLRGEVDLGIEELGPMVEVRRDHGAYRGIGAMVLAVLYGTACDPRARPTSIDAIEQHEWIDPLGTSPIALAIASMVAGATGDIAEARALAERGEVGSEPWCSIWIGRARAQVDHLQGDDAAARAACATAAERALDTSHSSYAAVTAHDLVRYGDSARATELLDEVLPVVEGCAYVALLHRHARAVTRGDRDTLRGCADEFAAQGAPWLSASCHHQLAELALSHDDQVGARRAVAAGDLAFDRLHPFRPPPSPVVADALTLREREVVALAADGLTSGAIAARLGRSVRTVDNHLHRVYGKLELDGREDLRTGLDRGSPGPPPPRGR